MTKMTKKDLIEALKDVPDDAIVGINVDHGNMNTKTYLAQKVLYFPDTQIFRYINGKKMPEVCCIYTHTDTDCMKF